MMRCAVNEANTPYLLSQVDVPKKENHLPTDSLDLESAVMSELVKLELSAKANKIAN